jgi:hypothetical protein
MSDAIETLKKTGTPPTVLGALQTLDADIRRIEGERYQADRERTEILKVQTAAASQLEKYLPQDEQAAAAERDKELEQLEKERLERTMIPTRGSNDTDGTYMARLLKRQIEESRRLSALTLALADVQAIGLAPDHTIIVSAVEEALATRAAPEAISRIGRAAEAKLQAIAAEEMKNGGTPGPAFQAHMLVSEKLRVWRAENARESVEARRDTVLRRHTLRTMNTRNNVLAAARLFNLEHLLTRAVAMAALQTEEK